jgi:alpha-L-fucosidase
MRYALALFATIAGCATSAVAADDVPVEVLRRAAQVTPSANQVAWQEMEFICFAHFGVNTFTDREWGEGREDPKLFNPTAFDAGQWVRACKAAGMKMIILTAKHHDGFCLFPSRWTEHSVKNSPWRGGRGDVVREVADACRAGGLKFGFYLSPWDRHERTYGTDAYNEYFKKQLRELAGNYGPVAEVWFDGACGEGPNGKRQVYDFAGYYQVIRELQPKAVIAIMGPDVRWVGNESGLARENEWSVLPDGGVSHQQKDLGHRKYLAGAKRLVWYPAECDVSIRPGWFYHAKEDAKVKSLAQMLDIYYRSVGRNSMLLVNVPPDRRGLFHENDVARLQELRAVLDETFRTNLAQGKPARASNVRGNEPAFGPAKAVDNDLASYWTTDDGQTTGWLEVDLGRPTSFDRALVQEQITVGQRVEEFVLEAWDGQAWKTITRAGTIGYKRLLRFPEVTTSRVRLSILQSRAEPTIRELKLFKAAARETTR